MKTPNRERQKKWKQKQVSKGMRSVTLMLPAEIKALIDSKRKETGKTISNRWATDPYSLAGQR